MFENSQICLRYICSIGIRIAYLPTNLHRRERSLYLLFVRVSVYAFKLSDPLLSGGSSQFTAASRIEMAEAVRPTLLEMTRHHDPAIPLPRHYFVSGLHWSQFFLHIFIHLPVYIAGGESDSGHWEFCQIVVSEHTITLEEFQDGCRHNQDDMVLDRWRLTIALASVQRHMSLLEQIIYPSSDASSSQSVAYSPFVNGMADDSIAW